MITTMEYVGEDFWSRPVYRCVETNILWKDMSLGESDPELYSCGNEWDGDPDSPIKQGIDVTFINMPEKVSERDKMNYMLLDRMRCDCEYFLNYGNRSVKNLSGDNVEFHIGQMKKLHDGFPEDKKPSWLTYDEILELERRMT